MLNRKLSIKIDKNKTTVSLLEGEPISVIINGLKNPIKKIKTYEKNIFSY